MQDTKKLLVNLIKGKVEEEKLVVNNLSGKLNDITNETFWSIQTIDINQIDIFKGIVPKKLTKSMITILKKEIKVYEILKNVYNMIQDRFKNDIWYPSRERLNIYVRDQMGLSSKERKMISHKEFEKEQIYSFTSALSDIQLIDYKEIMRNLIYFGMDDFAYIDSIT